MKNRKPRDDGRSITERRELGRGCSREERIEETVWVKYYERVGQSEVAGVRLGLQTD